MLKWSSAKHHRCCKIFFGDNLVFRSIADTDPNQFQRNSKDSLNPVAKMQNDKLMEQKNIG